MGSIYLDANVQSVSNNVFYQTRAVVWTEDNLNPRAVMYSIGPTTTAEVWEGYSCISSDLAFAMAYLRGAGFTDVPTFESFDAYSSLVKDIGDDFDRDLRESREEKRREMEAPF